jgi:hypothetical protein
MVPMKELHSEIEIAASPERVWTILTDFASYPGWNLFIERIGGEPKVGERLEVRLEPPGSRGITLKPTVLNAEPDRELRWLVVVYEKLGLMILKRTWFNIDLLWAGALVGAGVITLIV